MRLGNRVMGGMAGYPPDDAYEQIRYLADDHAYQRISYETVSSRVKKGCAENRIVDGLLAIMDQI